MTALRLFLSALATAARQPRAWLLGWLLVTLPALFLVWPLLLQLRQAFDHQPAATATLGESLDLDFAREHPQLFAAGAGAVLLVLLGWTFLGGGILATAGRRPRASLAEFFGACGSGLWPSLRVLAVGLVLALLLGWGFHALDAWLQDELAGVDPGDFLLPSLPWRVLTVGFALEALQWLEGLLFVLLLFASKLARARLCAGSDRSAFLAWLRAGLRLLRHPLRALLVVLLLVATWLLVGLLVGYTVAWFEAGGQVWPMLAASQLHVLALQVLLVAMFVAARSFAGIEPAGTAEVVIYTPEELLDEHE